MNEEIELLNRVYDRMVKLGGHLLLLGLASVLLVIWIPCTWKITATLAFLLFVCALTSIGVKYRIKQIKESET